MEVNELKSDSDEVNIMFHYEAGEGIKLSIENNNTKIVYLQRCLNNRNYKLIWFSRGEFKKTISK